MKKILKAIKDNFLLVHNFSVWLFALLSPLVFLPAIFSDHFNTTVVKGIAVLLITALVALFYIFLPSEKSLGLGRKYMIFSVLALVVGVVALLTDIQLDKIYTAEKPTGSKNYVVIGSAFRDSIQNLLANRHIDASKMTPEVLFRDYPLAEVSDIYEVGDINRHAYLLLGIYFFVILSLVTFIILTAYAIQIKNQLK